MISALLKKIGDIVNAEFKTTIIDRLSRVETKIDRIESDVTEVKSDVKQLQSRVGRLESATVEVQGVLKNMGAQLHQPLLVTPGSPLKLTDAGEELLAKINGRDFLNKNKDFLFALLDKENPKTQYDVQEMSKKVLRDSVPHPIMEPLKKYSYESGTPLENLFSIVAIIFRDAYLAAHPEITQ